MLRDWHVEEPEQESEPMEFKVAGSRIFNRIEKDPTTNVSDRTSSIADSCSSVQTKRLIETMVTEGRSNHVDGRTCLRWTLEWPRAARTGAAKQIDGSLREPSLKRVPFDGPTSARPLPVREFGSELLKAGRLFDRRHEVLSRLVGRGQSTVVPVA